MKHHSIIWNMRDTSRSKRIKLMKQVIDGGSYMRKWTIMMLTCVLIFVPIMSGHADEHSNKSFQEQIIYDILVDRFNNGNRILTDETDIDDPNSYQGGDLQGITMKLDEIEQHGFTAISISPIMENSSDGFHGYWIEDFFEVEEQFGTMDDLKQLVEEAHKRDMKVILEFVTNFVSLNHPFLSDDAKQDWFLENDVERTEATSWLDNTAVLNQRNPEVVSYLKDVATYWLEETDIDGIKIHAADQADPDFLSAFVTHLKEVKPDLYVLANVMQDEQSLEWLQEIEQIDGIENPYIFEAFNEILIQPDKPISSIYEVWETFNTGKDIVYVDHKNTARFSNNFADEGRNALTTWKLALTYLFTLNGTPVVFQGSELPMYGPSYVESQQMVQFQNRDQDLQEFYERISAIRKQFPAFSFGNLEQVATEEGMSVFRKSYEDETIYIALNNDSVSHAVSISSIDSNLQLRGLIGDDLVRADEDGIYHIGLPREEVEIYIIEPNEGLNWGLISFVVGVFILFVAAVIVLSNKDRKRKKENSY